MAKLLVPDELWAKVEPLLPPVREAGTRGRPPVPNRAALTGILFVLKTGIAWEDLPAEMNCGCGMTCWRRLRDWDAAGVWQRLHELLLAERRGATGTGRDGRRRVIRPRFFGGADTGPSPVDRGKTGSKHHVLTDLYGTPLVVKVTKANEDDRKQLIPMVDAVPPVAGKLGAPKRKPKYLLADRGYDSNPHRAQVESRRIQPVEICDGSAPDDRGQVVAGFRELQNENRVGFITFSPVIWSCRIPCAADGGVL